ncbi:HN1_G0027660.mRNA.1.CDS.1 [Saccharomyces cerevisiae]|nr:HN1_G0027660.mRNA.1.CDS.1 [Saccharomyces cerevisiae]CAI4601588.1 BAL_1a_G0035380.mRNA.1.CDS.1 [Saccharomyces cerevisiae]CAI7226083.1 BAL_1a_G0035380.mRNA.1.CDS.1 [Saccharomyces cerevisiae]
MWTNTFKWCSKTEKETTTADAKVCASVQGLKALQQQIMDSTTVRGSVNNTMTPGGINQWHFHNKRANKVCTPTVLIHGYAASSMAFYRTFENLSDNIKDLYAIDLPANGASEAPALQVNKTKKIKSLRFKHIEDDVVIPVIEKRPPAEDIKSHLEQYESYFVDRIEQWRKDNRLRKINVVGHSFGGYISFKYALKYPDSIEKLCLISPLGVENSIHAITHKWEPNTTYPLTFTDPSSRYYTRKLNVPRFIFENQLNVLKWMGPIGSKLCSNYISTAYVKVPDQIYKDYLLHSFVGKNQTVQPQTIKVFTHLFERNLIARDPIINNVRFLNPATPVMFMYGEHDWMDKYAGYLTTESMLKNKAKASYVEVPDAGHNLFLDNPQHFASSLVSFLSK